MSGLKRGAIAVEHPGQLADAAREMSGLPASSVPYYEHANYIDDNGQPLVSIPDPGPQPGDYEVPALNSPQGMARMRLREMGSRSGRSPSSQALGIPDPEILPTEALEPAHEVLPVGNVVHLDDAVAYLDGQFVPLDDMELGRIQGIIVRAYQRKLAEDFKRVKSAYTMQSRSRKQKAVPKRRNPRRKAVSTPPPVQEGTATENEG